MNLLMNIEAFAKKRASDISLDTVGCCPLGKELLMSGKSIVDFVILIKSTITGH